MKRSEIERLLPGVIQRTVHPNNPLQAILEVMEAMHAADEKILEQLDIYFDPYRAPDDFVPFLAHWVDLVRFLPADINEVLASSAPLWPPGLGRLRELIANSAELSRWRGTAQGLVRFLETATGLTGFEIDEQPLNDEGMPQPFHVVVSAPVASSSYETLLHRIIGQEKPAYVSYELRFDA